MGGLCHENRARFLLDFAGGRPPPAGGAKGTAPPKPTGGRGPPPADPQPRPGGLLTGGGFVPPAGPPGARIRPPQRAPKYTGDGEIPGRVFLA